MSEPSPAVRSRLAENLARTRERIAAASRASGRAADAVTLVAVTKYIPSAWAAILAAEGCHDLGESRPQELWTKAEALADAAVRWHFIGHMQRNKLRRSLPWIALFHSIDSPRLLAALDEEARAAGRSVRALIEINISGEANKGGFTPSEIEPLIDQLPNLAGLKIEGLMGMAGLEANAQETEKQFEQLRSLRDRLIGRLPAGMAWPHLSMGMSGDFEAAIRQGATLVRIGSALVEGLSTD